VIRNIFAYSIWDGQQVDDHLMVIPKKHTDTLADLNEKEAVDYVRVISAYELNGYNVYSRAPQSAIKSVIHLHTHLIKTSGPPKKVVFLARKPYIRIIF
jgi:diadenosine tetraphosphate (Ap4A) HIT family hydrolase